MLCLQSYHHLIAKLTHILPSFSPYGDMDDRVRFISMQMGLTPIIWTQYEGRAFDTQGASRSTAGSDSIKAHLCSHYRLAN